MNEKFINERFTTRIRNQLTQLWRWRNRPIPIVQAAAVGLVYGALQTVRRHQAQAVLAGRPPNWLRLVESPSYIPAELSCALAVAFEYD